MRARALGWSSKDDDGSDSDEDADDECTAPWFEFDIVFYFWYLLSLLVTKEKNI